MFIDVNMRVDIYLESQNKKKSKTLVIVAGQYDSIKSFNFDKFIDFSYLLVNLLL
jgi:hypothetical protein